MLKIYGVPISVHTRKVIIAARLKKLPFELIPVVPVLPPDQLPPNWRQLSPTGLVPALQDGDFTLADSSAICAYLERKWPTPALHPSDAQRYAHALWLEQYASGTVFGNVVRPLFHEAFVHPKVRGIATDPVVVGDVLGRVLPEAFGYLESVSGGSFLAGDAVSVADLAVMSNLTTMQYVGFALDRKRYPKLAALYERVLRVPEVSAALRAEQPVVQQMGLEAGFLGSLLA
jgi:glutathione S-transferase